MIQIVENTEQLQKLKTNLQKQIPDTVLNALEERLIILDECYGPDRDWKKDLGGYGVIVHPGTTQNELRRWFHSHRISENDYEYMGDLCTVDGVSWKERLFMLNNDYGIVMMHSERRGTV